MNIHIGQARVLIVIFAMVVLGGCSSSNGNAPALDASGKHPAGWIVTHGGFFRTQPGAIDSAAAASASSCTECHGNDLRGGIAKVSCFSPGFGAQTCHFHPADFMNSTNHGATAKGAGVFKGFANCQGCHGSGYAGGFLTNVSCSSQISPTNPAFACHGVAAPHAKNWATSVTSDHSTTDQVNAPQCYQCHAGGRNLVTLPVPPTPPAGTPPGCFNNTLCHAAIGHPAGWADPAQHGAAAKSQPGTSSGFPSCQNCHGADLKGGIVRVSCLQANTATGPCHVRAGTTTPTGAPHAQSPWRTNPSPTHTSTVDDTNGLNAAVCGQCHKASPTLPPGTRFGCFNATLCHGAVGHPAGWADPTQHGATAKADLTFCQQCHSNNSVGGPGSNPRFNVPLGRMVQGCEDCHAPFAAHPPVNQIPASYGTINNPDPLGTPWFRHRTATNFDACNRCHGANLDGVGATPGAPACTSCHRSGLPTTLKNCTSCHGSPPNGTAYPNIASAHPAHRTLNVANLCAECHLGFGTGTLSHFQRAALQPTPQVAGIAFGTLAKTGGLVPAYTSTTQQCTNTYCHGNTLDTPATAILSPSWNVPFLTGVASNDCVKCHGYPPATATHAGLGPTDCIFCHPHVNAGGTGFTDPTKHVNGTIDVSAGLGHAFPFTGAAHKATTAGEIASTCLGCHTLGTTGSVYPATSLGAPPDCRGCHLNANPGTDPQCSDCHGAAANNGNPTNAGRPNGAAFPNNARNHSASRHQVACPICHAGGGTGVATHGNSNHVVKTLTNVTVSFSSGTTATVTNMTFTFSGASGTCTGTCHNLITNVTQTHNNDTW